MLLRGSTSLALASHSRSMAQYAHAEALQRRLHLRPVAQRTRADYERALDAFRVVYHGDPASPDAAPAIAAVADLLAEEGHCFHDPRLLHDAVAQWKFLQSQYPGSPLRRRARQQEADIERLEFRHGASAKNAVAPLPAGSKPSALSSVQRPNPAGSVSLARTSSAPVRSVAPIRNGAASLPGVVHASRVSSSPVPEPETQIAILQDVRSWTQGSLTRVAVDLSGPAAYRVYPAPERHQMVLIVFGARPAGSLLNHAISFQRDLQIRAANVRELTHDQTEIVLQLARPLKVSSFTLTKPDRVILDLREIGENGPVQTAPPEKFVSRSLPPPSPSATKDPSILWNSASGPAQTGQRSQRSMTRVLGLRVRRIVIDPGHGGHDSGTLGPGGLKEKDVALDVALRLGRLLQQQMDAEVIYTRSTDKFVPLEQRTALANHAHADLFLSIHANSSPDPDARGVETYFLNFTASPGALNVAARENAVSNRSVYELSDLVRRITLSDKIDESRAFAEDVQQSLYTGLAAGNEGLKNRGVKQAPFVVLIGAHMPSILAEISFLTNPLDAEELAQPEYRQRLAEALYRGVSEYVDGMSGMRVAKTAPVRMMPAQAE